MHRLVCILDCSLDAAAATHATLTYGLVSDTSVTYATTHSSFSQSHLSRSAWTKSAQLTSCRH
eukprot:1245415-Pleurochrysis_carterae.AAC.1